MAGERALARASAVGANVGDELLLPGLGVGRHGRILKVVADATILPGRESCTRAPLGFGHARPALRSVSATKYLTPFREGGSLPGLVEADDDGLYVVKLSGAAQGPRALVAEVIAGDSVAALGLPVPELVLVDSTRPSPGSSRTRGSGELLGEPRQNLGLDFLPGALTFDPRADGAPDPDLAAAIVWFDALVTNTDRSPRNPNLLSWHRRLWLIDHGASLYIHHTWRDPEPTPAGPSPRSRRTSCSRMPRPRRGARSTLAAGGEPFLRSSVALVPDAWLAVAAAIGGPVDQREGYVRYLLTRVAARDALATSIEEVRHAA